MEPTPEPEPLIAAQQQEAPIVTFVTNMGQGPGDRTTITTSTVTGRATHDQGFTTGSDNSLFLLESLEVQALVNSDFLGTSIWTDNNGSIGEMLFDLERVGGSGPKIYSAADVYLLPNTKYWVRFEAQEFTFYDETELTAETVGLFGADLDDEDSGGLSGWTIDGLVKVSLKGRVIDLGGTVQVPGTAVSNLDNTRERGYLVPNNGTEYAQRFITGADASGYSLGSVKLNLSSDSAGTAAVPVVTVHADNSGFPAAAVLSTLSGPSVSGTTPQDYTFTASGSARLAAGTTYWVKVVSSTSVSVSVSVSVEVSATRETNVERVDSGWSLPQGRLRFGGQSWVLIPSQRRLMMAVEIEVDYPERLVLQRRVV